MSYLPVLDSMKNQELKNVVFFKFYIHRLSGVALSLHNEAELQGLLSQLPSAEKKIN